MKRIIATFLIFSIFNFTCLPSFSANNIKKPRVNVFNRAVKNGEIEKVKAFIEAGFNPNETYWGTSVISTAIDEKQNEMFDFLLDNGAEVNPPKSQVSPLGAAILYNNTYAAQKLIEKGADVNNTFLGIKDCDNGLREAIRNHNNEMLDLFLNNGGNPNANFTTPLLHYAVLQNNAYAIEKLIHFGANRNIIAKGATAEQLAIDKEYYHLLEIFEKYDTQENLSKENLTDINKSIDLLKDTILGPIFYDYIKGANLTKKPIIVRYIDFTLLDFIDDDLLGTGWIKNKQLYIYINSKFKNSSPEALATLIASLTIHQDKKDSINEEIYSATLQAALWTDFTNKNPNLKLEKSALVNTLNFYADFWKTNNYNVNAFKPFIKQHPVYKNLAKTSPGFSNKDIGLLKDESLIKKTTENVISYCKEHNITTTLLEACEVIALLGLVALGTYTICNSTINTTPINQPVLLPPTPQLRPMVIPNWKYQFNYKTQSIDKYIQSVTIRSFY